MSDTARDYLIPQCACDSTAAQICPVHRRSWIRLDGGIPLPQEFTFIFDEQLFILAKWEVVDGQLRRVRRKKQA